jgi:hypothetical protein
VKLLDSVDDGRAIILCRLKETPSERGENEIILNDAAVQGCRDRLSFPLSLNRTLVLATARVYSCLNSPHKALSVQKNFV